MISGMKPYIAEAQAAVAKGADPNETIQVIANQAAMRRVAPYGAAKAVLATALTGDIKFLLRA